MKKLSVTDRYEDIIDHPHYQSKARPQMPRYKRAAQFAPFAALTGYDAAIEETGRRTQERIIPGSEQIELLNRHLSFLYENLSQHPPATITYFIPDEYKEGGRYERVSGHIKKIDDIEGFVTLDEDITIAIKDMIDIECDHNDL